MTRKKYQTYSREFKVEAVRLAEQSDKPGKSVRKSVKEKGVRVPA